MSTLLDESTTATTTSPAQRLPESVEVARFKMVSERCIAARRTAILHVGGLLRGLIECVGYRLVSLGRSDR